MSAPPDNELSDDQARSIVDSVIRNHWGRPPDRIEALDGGLSNYVFAADVGGKSYIVRFSPSAEKIESYLKEKWAIEKAGQKGVPTSEILHVGTEPVSVPYLIARKAVGSEATHHPNRFAVLREMGRLTALIHSIPTHGYGSRFDWAGSDLMRKETWADFLREELEVEERMATLDRYQMLTREQKTALAATVEQMMTWTDQPSLHHGDMRLKNVLVDEHGTITAVIDWEHSLSSIPPYWDLAIALHDLSIDAKEVFLEGYEMSGEQIRQAAPYIRAVNQLQYAPFIERAAEQNDQHQLERLRTRLLGALNLYGCAT